MKKTIIAVIIGLGLVSSQTFSLENKLPLKEISKVAEVFSKISDDYVDPVNNSKLMINGLRGMVNGLDPYSHYLSKEELTDFASDISGENVGIGAVLSKNEIGLKIETVLKNSPAEKAGLKSGDIIIKVNNQYLLDHYENVFDAIKDIKGKVGTYVNISVQQHNDKKIKDIKIKRDSFVVPSTTVKLLDNKYGYIYISSFQENTSKDLLSKITEFLKINPNTNGFVLDLRSNPGGLLTSATEISDFFLNDGIIVSTKGKNENSSISATKGDILNNLPLVVLIDSGTASAAEIVSGALQDNKRAVIVGQTSYGKGSVQTIIPLNGNDGDAIKLTIARYYTPSGRSIQAEGIVPDIYIKPIKNIELLEEQEYRESDNINHIENDTDYTSKKESDVIKDDEHIYSEISKDYDLYQAVNTLKAISFSK